MKNEILLALVERLITDAIAEYKLENPSLRGPRGLPGKAARDFCFEDYEEKITEIIKNSIPTVKDGVDGKDFIFEDHEERITEIVKSNIPIVKDGVDGKDFIFDEHSESITEIILRNLPKVKDGEDGKDFVFEEHAPIIFNKIEEVFNAVKDSLKLRFSDLNEEEKNSLKLKFDDLSEDERHLLRGARGQKGKQGRDFQFEEHKPEIKNVIAEYVESIKSELKGKDGKTVRGSPGIAGLNGRNGIDGKDGEDAPVITRVEINQEKDKTFRFEFQFDDGSVIETNKVSLPVKHSSSTMYYNMTDSGSANIIIPNVVCDSSVYVGAAVRMIADGSCVNAQADTYDNANVIGICQSKETSTLCTIRVMGVSTAIYSGLDLTEDYFLDAYIAGGMTTAIPTVTGQVKLKLGQPFSTERLFVMKGERVVRG